MNAEQIQNFLSKKTTANDKYVKIHFQKRDALYGLFLTEESDFKELSKKNFWRIVTKKHFDEYNRSKDANLSRIFNGSEITRLSPLNDEFDNE